MDILLLIVGLGLILANDGIHPDTGKRLLSSQAVKIVKTLMFTCGMYDGSGEFAVRSASHPKAASAAVSYQW